MMYFRKCFIMRKKIIIEFKHIRFKSSVNEKLNITAKETSNLRIRKLSEILGCTSYTAREMVVKNKNILGLESTNFIINAKFCSEYFKLSDIIEFPCIISMNSNLLQHRYFTLKELGCSNVTAINILKFLHFIKKTPTVLKNEGVSLCLDEQFYSLMNFVNCSNQNELKSRLMRMYKDDSTLWKIKEVITAEFLSAKLDCSLNQSYQMLHRYPPLRLQSIANTDQLLDILLHKLEFPVSKVCKSPNLLSLHHEIVQHFLTEVPEILGVSIVKIANKSPMILKRPVDSVRKIESVLKNFNVSDTQLLCCPKIVIFTPNTLHRRLEDLCRSEGLSSMRSYKKFLWLVYYYNNVHPRLEALKAIDMPYSPSMFTVSKTIFYKYLLVGEYRTSINDVCVYLSDVFNYCEKEILSRLREYPNYQNSSLGNSRKVVEFLMSSGVSKKQILNGIGIILYDIDVVKVYFDDMKRRPECQPFTEWVNHYNLIQLLIYTIEVDVGFRGSRLYLSKIKSEEPDILLLSGHGY